MTNYSNGAGFERDMMYELESVGYKTIRSAGSHGPADFLAGRLFPYQLPKGLDFCEPQILAVQAKKYKTLLSPAEAHELVEFSRSFEAIPVLVNKPKPRVSPNWLVVCIRKHHVSFVLLDAKYFKEVPQIA